MTRLTPLLLLACTSNSTIVEKRSADTGRTPVSTDDCDESPDAIICIDGKALTCDGAGNISAEERCSDETVCVVDAGCVDCTIDLSVQLSTAGTAALVPVQTQTWVARLQKTTLMRSKKSSRVQTWFSLLPVKVVEREQEEHQ